MDIKIENIHTNNWKELQLFLVPTKLTEKDNQSPYVSCVQQKIGEKPTWHYFSKPSDEQEFFSRYDTPYHMYLVSDEEIQNYDWYINFSNKKFPYLNRSGETKFEGLYENCKKVVATTNTNIFKPLSHDGKEFGRYHNIPVSFIIAYVYLANGDNFIKSIHVLHEKGILDCVDSLIYSKSVICKEINLEYRIEKMFELIESFVMSTPQSLSATPERRKKIDDWHLENFGFTLHEIIADTNE